MISLAGGCVCCSFGSDLMAALMDLSQLSPPPERVLIEASGVAMPGAIAASVDLLTPMVDGVLVLADSETVAARRRPVLGDTTGKRRFAIAKQCAPADLAATGGVVSGENAAAVVPMTATRRRGRCCSTWRRRRPGGRAAPTRWATTKPMTA